MKRLLHLSVLSIALLLNANTAGAQSGTYFREGFMSGTFATTATDAVPGQYRTLDSSGTWYSYGTYRTTGATGACTDQSPSHVRFANLNAVTTTNDSSYLITPVLNFGIGFITFYNSRAARRFTILKTSDTLATTNNWTAVTLVPLTNAACDLVTVTINDATAKRIKMIARGGTDSDIDSLSVTSTLQILPVKFAGFSAAETSGKVKLNWNIASELNAAKYVVERSFGNGTFSEVGSLPAGQYSSYNWIDYAPNSGVNLYRIRAVDKDGASLYTSVVKISLGKKAMGVAVTPNPVKGTVANIQLQNFVKGSYILNLYNAAGQQVLSSSISLDEGSSSYPLQLPSSVKAGLYNLQIKNGETVVNTKVIVE